MILGHREETTHMNQKKTKGNQYGIYIYIYIDVLISLILIRRENETEIYASFAIPYCCNLY